MKTIKTKTMKTMETMETMVIRRTSPRPKAAKIAQGLLLCLFLLTLGFPVGAIRAQATGPQMEAGLAWNGYHAQTWTEVQVTLNNEGSDWEGVLEVQDSIQEMIYRQDLRLPAHSQKMYRVPFYTPNIQITVVLRSAAGEELQKKQLRLNSTGAAEGRFVCALLSGSAETARENPTDSSRLCKAAVLLRDPRQLPETPMAWDSLGLLALDGIDTSGLTPAQQEALLAWVAAGGQLLVSGGAALPQTLTGLPAPLQIAQGNAPFSLPAAPFDPDRPLAGITLRPAAETRTLVQDQGLTLGAQRPFGQGKVIVLGWNLTVDDWAWLNSTGAVISRGAITLPERVGTPLSKNAEPGSYYLLNIPADILPSLVVIILVFLGYILIMGPLSWGLTRRLKKPIQGWLLFPAWIALTLIILGLSLSGIVAPVFPIRHEVAFVYVPAQNAPARVIQSAAFYAPQARQMNWKSSGFPRPLLGGYDMETGYYQEGRPFPAVIIPESNGLSRVETRHRGPLTWGTEGLIAPPPITVTWSVTQTLNTNRIHGTLEAAFPFKQARLYMMVHQNNIQSSALIDKEDPVSAGDPIQFRTVLTNDDDLTTPCSAILSQSYAPYGYYGYPAPVYMPGTQTTTPYVPPNTNQCYLGLVTEDVPLPAQINGQAQRESCIFYVLPCPTQPENSQVSLSPDMFVGYLEADGSLIGNNYVNFDRSPMILYYPMPAFPRLTRANRLALEITDEKKFSPSTSPTFPGTLELWNWERSAWVEQTLQLNRLELKGPSAQAFVDPDQGVRIRISGDPSTYSMFALGIEIQGVR